MHFQIDSIHWPPVESRQRRTPEEKALVGVFILPNRRAACRGKIFYAEALNHWREWRNIQHSQRIGFGGNGLAIEYQVI